MPQILKANKTVIAFIISLGLMRLILGFAFFESIRLPGANITILPMLVVALIFPDKYHTKALRTTIPFAAWALIAYVYSYIQGASKVVTLLNYIDTIGAMYLLIFFFELRMSKEETKGPRVDVYKWIWILLIINTAGYSVSDGVLKNQLFSSQIVPIAAVSLQNPLFDKVTGVNVLKRYFLGGSSIILLYMLEARAALVASAFAFACGCIFQAYLKITVTGRIYYICKTIGHIALPRSSKGIEIGVISCFIGYCVWLSWLNSSYLPSLGLSRSSLVDYISRIEMCNYAEAEEKSIEKSDGLYCNSLIETPAIQRDVSVIVRVSSDAVFASNAARRPINLILPELTTSEETEGSKYLYRSHNLIIHLIQQMGVPSAILLLSILKQYVKRAESMAIICPTLFPVILLSLFTLNDINYSIPFLVF